MKRIQTRRGLAEQLGWHHETLSKKLHEIGIKHSGALTPLDLELVANKIGTPEKLRQMTAVFLK